MWRRVVRQIILSAENYLFQLLPWDMTPYILVEIYLLFGDTGIPNFYSKGRGSRYLRKVTRFLPDYSALHRRRWNFACTLLTFCVFGIHAASRDTFVSVAQWGWFQHRTYLIAALRGVRRDNTREVTVTNLFQPQSKAGSRLLGWQ